MEKKITKRERFESLLTFAEVQADSGMVDFINHEIELLNRKSSSERKPTAAQIENENLKNAIFAYMEDETSYTADDLRKAVPELAEIEATNQKVSALMNAMVKPEDGRIVKSKDGKRTVFSKA